MQVNNVESTSFGRVVFVNKNVKKAFLQALSDPRYTSRDKLNKMSMKSLSEFLILQENNRHDRLMRVGMTQIKGKDYFTNALTGEVLGVTKRGKQNICTFLIDLFKIKK